MQIRVKCSYGEGKCPQWAIVELQGIVELQPAFQDSFHNLPIGLLCRPSSQEKYTFTVGYHELNGSKVPLKKPLLVIKKTKHSDTSKNDDLNISRELEVTGIIRHWILFKTRPNALISSIALLSFRFLEKANMLTTGCKGQTHNKENIAVFLFISCLLVLCNLQQEKQDINLSQSPNPENTPKE